MRIYYSILDALSYLKKEIERLEKRMKEEKNSYYRFELESLVEWNFERGLNILKHAKTKEVTQEVIDFYLGRIKERPDLKRLKEKLRENDKT